MTIQTPVDYISTSDFFSRPLEIPKGFAYAVLSTAEEAQLADEMMEMAPVILQHQPLPEIDADEFEKLFGIFHS